MKILLGGLGIAAMLIASPGLAYLTQPWAPWWIGKHDASAAVTVPIGSSGTGTGGLIVPTDPGIPLDPPAQHAGIVSDAERYQLALAAGFSSAEAIIATAISIAEDGSGNPAALSPPNKNGTRDLGLLQINSIHWASCGGQAALEVPINNFRCGYGIYGPGHNWCAWSTYERSCGVGYTGAYAAFLPCARAISEGNTCRR